MLVLFGLGNLLKNVEKLQTDVVARLGYDTA